MSNTENLKEQLIKPYDVVIIGAGPAGLAAALRSYELGIKNILVIERDSYPGGILPQCIHPGFGLKIFNSELTGPQYSQIFIDKLKNTSVEILLDTMALSIKADSNKAELYDTLISGTETNEQRLKTPRTVTCAGNPDFLNSIIEITVTGKKTGFKTINAKSVILALGCRERTRGQILIPGARPAGVFTAGLVQRMVNIEGYLPGKEAVILGSGDIGLIMARRLTLEGCRVKGVYELMPFSTGLLRNISQCLEDYNIPLYLSHTVTDIIGSKRLEAVQVCRVDQKLKPVLSSAQTIKCDTLLLSVGLIPENELAKTCGVTMDGNTGGPIVDEDFQTSVPGIFSCGNSLFVYDLVDNVTEDGYKAAESAAGYLEFPGINMGSHIDILPGENTAYVVPQKISGRKNVDFKIRAKVPLKNATLEITGTNFKKRFKHVNPGEMLFISMPKDFSAGRAGAESIILNIRGDRVS